jgi:hypothetical protein
LPEIQYTIRSSEKYFSGKDLWGKGGGRMSAGPEPGFWKVFFAICSRILGGPLSEYPNKKRRKPLSNPCKTLTGFFRKKPAGTGFPGQNNLYFSEVRIIY